MSAIIAPILFKRELPQRCACGGKPEMYIITGQDCERYAIGCTSCGRLTSNHKTEAEAMKEWNG